MSESKGRRERVGADGVVVVRPRLGALSCIPAFAALHRVVYVFISVLSQSERHKQMSILMPFQQLASCHRHDKVFVV